MAFTSTYSQGFILVVRSLATRRIIDQPTTDHLLFTSAWGFDSLELQFDTQGLKVISINFFPNGKSRGPKNWYNFVRTCYIGFCQGISFTLPLARSFTCSYNSRMEMANGQIFGLNIPWLLTQSWNKDFYISSFGSAWPLSRIFVNRVKMLFLKIKTHFFY